MHIKNPAKKTTSTGICEDPKYYTPGHLRPFCTRRSGTELDFLFHCFLAHITDLSIIHGLLCIFTGILLREFPR